MTDQIPPGRVLPIELSDARTEAMKAHLDKTAALAELFPEASNLKELQQAINEHFGVPGDKK